MPAPEYFHSSKRLGFRFWTADDFDLARQLWGDPEVTRLFSKEPFSEEQIRERLNTEIERAAENGVQYWPIFELSTQANVGCCGLRPYRPGEKIYELGFHLRPAHWGKGYATEAARAALDYAREKLDLIGIFAGHHPENKASKRVLLKLGFAEIGAEFYPPTGLLHPGYMLKLSRVADPLSAS
jgi:RimJ/RimL family protein N-acetyltransferase